MKKQIDKKCKDCLHYKMCLERFRKLKKENHYILIDESEYFEHADDCEFHIKSTDVAREIFEEIDTELGNELEKADDETIVFNYDGIVDRVLEKLKKKYTESEGADDEG